ncbi:aminotransferase class V-fold PLP-dependent enzyme [Nakamurella leprariae]|uniref:Aminotransferase class V-fold PLP-dependent enzyme n=1 Tax=Nakamurella leprariae TaxID=2803911 RepID=A0A938YFC1_9ACTN|nr:aminotransferase class V-fold PLP-dependent enzyme [Nakamurella leprariae]MBM9467377.1 aminotransferase class V-fold PLP-dependent enzyme [Nakamurella leprariae]
MSAADTATTSEPDRPSDREPDVDPGTDPLPAPLTVDQAATLWEVEPGYLNSASYGPPPRPAWTALQEALEQWRHARTSWEGWATAVDTSRVLFAELVGVDASHVATGVSVSQLLAPAAAAVPDGATVLVPDVEFTSNVFPWAVHAGRGVTVRSAPADRLADAITEDVDVVACSAVQSATGQVTDLAAVSAAARAVGALTVVDSTQATGWLPLDPDAADLLVCGAYKWLCSPRGTAFLVHHPTLADRHPAFADRLLPLAAGWFAGADVHDSYYGLPLRLAQDARRFDISPAWHSWVGTAPALRVLADVGPVAIGRHDVALANEFLAGLDRPPSDSAIVSVPADPAAVARLTAAGVRFGMRAGQVRVAFHLYTTSQDVELAVRALRG